MYDIIVIGAGSSGAVIAARASEDPQQTVLLLEAGPDYAELSDTPFDLINSHNNSYHDHDWGFSYHPTAGRRAQPLPRGKVSGGSSAVNTTIALRGMPEDYDEWAALGNPAWSWAQVLPAFKRLERDLDFGTAPYHGDAGPISIRRHCEAELTTPQQTFLEACERLGYPVCEDANEPGGWGAGPHPMNKLGRVRISTAVGYLAPARIRQNLTIQSRATVHRLLVERGRVVAVEVECEGRVERLEARLFILCAGAIQSPAILIRSGIGPRATLASLGIPEVRDISGVGANLCDHPVLSVICEAKDPDMPDPDAPIVQTLLRYTADGDKHDRRLSPLALPDGGATGDVCPGRFGYVYGASCTSRPPIRTRAVESVLRGRAGNPPGPGLLRLFVQNRAQWPI